MLYHKIFIAEQRIKNDLKENNQKLMTIERIKDFLNRVDSRVEFIAASNQIDLESVVSDLKGERLNEEESAMIREIFNANGGESKIGKNEFNR